MNYESAEQAGILSAAWSALTKVVTFKGLAGMLGAGMLYMLMPPGPPVMAGTVISDPKAYRWATRKELCIRFAFAFMSSEWAGDWFVDVVANNAAWLQAAKHPNVFIGMMGAGGWYAGRWVALWLHQRQNTGLDQVIKDVKGMAP